MKTRRSVDHAMSYPFIRSNSISFLITRNSAKRHWF